MAGGPFHVKKVLYGVSPIGLGHATRSLEVVRKLAGSGVEVRVFSGGVASEFLSREGLGVDDIVDDPVPSVAGGEMKRATLWYARSWVALRRSERRTDALVAKWGPDLVVCDEEFSGMVVSRRRGVANVFMSDELELGFARSWLARKVEERVYRWYRDLQRSAGMVLVPDEGRDEGNVKHVGPIVRRVTEGREAVLARLHLPQDARLVLVSMSGSGIGGYLARKAASAFREASIPGAVLAVSGNRGRVLFDGSGMELGLVPHNQNLVGAADLVISTAGKSTIDEAVSSGTPIIAIPIAHHAEQERNAAELGFSASDIDRLPELIRTHLGRRSAPRESKGAEKAAAMILSML
jgi:UDP-N-acetylglucosamine--N-acetylmuramyl-(pentapeptide) pyrophosphoryl-undecaprenol N-acetylglucosamine transferase